MPANGRTGQVGESSRARGRVGRVLVAVGKVAETPAHRGELGALGVRGAEMAGAPVLLREAIGLEEVPQGGRGPVRQVAAPGPREGRRSGRVTARAVGRMDRGLVRTRATLRRATDDREPVKGAGTGGRQVPEVIQGPPPAVDLETAGAAGIPRPTRVAETAVAGPAAIRPPPAVAEARAGEATRRGMADVAVAEAVVALAVTRRLGAAGVMWRGTADVAVVEAVAGLAVTRRLGTAAAAAGPMATGRVVEAVAAVGRVDTRPPVVAAGAAETAVQGTRRQAEAARVRAATPAGRVATRLLAGQRGAVVLRPRAAGVAVATRLLAWRRVAVVLRPRAGGVAAVTPLLGGRGGAVAPRPPVVPGGQAAIRRVAREVAAPIGEVLVLGGPTARPVPIVTGAQQADIPRRRRGGVLAPARVARVEGIHPGPAHPTAERGPLGGPTLGTRGGRTDRVEIAGPVRLAPPSPASLPQPANGAALPATARGCWPNRRMAQPLQRGEKQSSGPGQTMPTRLTTKRSGYATRSRKKR
ncbi:MAG: hypothetical protein QOF30_3014 [Acidimicrobiaceae bacterium]|nr:hypothetical protein [Acidimicrobiaceae bacterium]